jgi:hypothetical protein
MAQGYRPLTLEELQAASEIFFSRFNLILERMPEKATIEDTLNVMEKVLKLGHKQRHDRERAQEFSFRRLRKIGFIQNNFNAEDEL